MVWKIWNGVVMAARTAPSTQSWKAKETAMALTRTWHDVSGWYERGRGGGARPGRGRRPTYDDHGIEELLGEDPLPRDAADIR